MALLGCIADDFTGATDLANNLVREGMRTVQMIGVPDAPIRTDADAIVIALKSRTIPVDEAVKASLSALNALREAGCERFFFKYCSTFDSTPEGNIGPVAEALMQALDVPFAIAAPAFPATGRTVYHGVLFVNGELLNESGMQHHPLTPMTDANLCRWLDAQTKGSVGLIRYTDVEAGAEAVKQRIAELRHNGCHLAIADTLHNTHLMTLGAAIAQAPLVTGGSGIALGLPRAWRAAGLLPTHADAADLGHFGGAMAIVSGSCSERTQAQVAAFAAQHPALAIDPAAAAEDLDEAVASALRWAKDHLAQGPILIYSTAAPSTVAKVQAQLGHANAGELIEQALARISEGLVQAGVKRLIVAGGETSGAVVNQLGLQTLRIGPQVDPGVPWTAAGTDLALALKSGNFGEVDFFTRAFEVCP